MLSVHDLILFPRYHIVEGVDEALNTFPWLILGPVLAASDIMRLFHRPGSWHLGLSVKRLSLLMSYHGLKICNFSLDVRGLRPDGWFTESR